MAYYGTGYYGTGSSGILAQGIYRLQEIGIVDVILPFILIFTIVFAILQKTKILGTEPGDDKKPKKNYNIVVALVMGLAVIIPHVTGSYPTPESDIVNIINQALPNVSVVLVAVIMMLLLIGVFGGGVDFTKSKLSGWIVVSAILLTLFIFGTAANWWQIPQWMGFMLDADTQALVVILLVFGLLIAFITADEKPVDKGKYSMVEDFGKVMGYKKD
ncbi:MAG: hypothetical protein ACP5NW_01540 [Candidatus Woesearchaeota archaeon]